MAAVGPSQLLHRLIGSPWQLAQESSARHSHEKAHLQNYMHALLLILAALG